MSTRTAQSATQFTKETIIEELKFYFNNVSQFGFPGNPVKAPVIRESYSTNIRVYPCIFLKTLNEHTQTLGLNKGFVGDVFSDDQTMSQQFLPGTENYAPPNTGQYPVQVPYMRRVIAERYGHLSDITLNLQVWDESRDVTNRITDEAIAALQRYRKESLQKAGIIVAGVSAGEDFDIPLNDTTHVFVSNIRLDVSIALYFDYPCSHITAIQPVASYQGNTSPDIPSYIIQTQDDT